MKNIKVKLLFFIFLINICSSIGCSNTEKIIANDTSDTGSNNSGNNSTTISDNNSITAANSNNYEAVSTAVPFQFVADSPESYVCKAKTLLTGLSCTADEINQVSNDANSLPSLIALWQKTPQYQNKMITFFSDAFQQRQIDVISFEAGGQQLPMFQHPELLKNFKESFARTAWNIVETGQPFTNTLSTQSFMLTPTMVLTYSYMDSIVQNDQSNISSPNFAQFNLKFVLQNTDSSVSFASSINPNSPNYFKFYVPNLANLDHSVFSPCPNTNTWAPLYTLDLNTSQYGLTTSYYNMLLGPYSNTFYYFNDANGKKSKQQCVVGDNYYSQATGNIIPFVSAADYNNWRLVTIRQPHSGESTTKFWDYNATHYSTTLVYNMPRVGFFTTPAFFGSWQTNSGNQHRVTMNQTLIAGLGKAIDGSDPTMPPSLAALDAAHAPSNSDCYSCHRTLDPMRQYFHQNYSYYYSSQTDANILKIPGQYAVQGISAQGNNILQLGQLMAQAPSFAQAWVQRLCVYANSAACVANDPEIVRLTNLFQSSGYSWNDLVAALFSSPIFTYSEQTPTALATEQVVSIARMDHFCANLSNRLNIPDICNSINGNIATIVSALPVDSYGRGSVLPVLPTNLDLIYRSGVESICTIISTFVVDGNAMTNQYSSSSPKTAIANMVTELMATPPSRADFVTQVLTNHYNNALAQKATPTMAMQSTFITACSSPVATLIGL